MTKDSVALSEYYRSLSTGERTRFIERLVEECKVPRYTVYNWKYGFCRIPQLHKDKIAEIIGYNIFDSDLIPENNQ